MKNERNWLRIILVLSLLITNMLSSFAANAATTTTPPPAPTLSYSPTSQTNGNVTVTAYFPGSAVVKQYRLGTNGVCLRLQIFGSLLGFSYDNGL